MAPKTVDTDTTLLRNRGFVDFLAAQEPDTAVFVPSVAAQIAKTILNVCAPKRTSRIKKFVPFVAVKSLGQPHTLRAIFSTGFKADVATLQEARFALWAGSGLITPADVSFTNLWVGEKDIHELVALGVRRFTVDKQNTVEWIAEAARAQGVDPSDMRITLRVLLANTPDQGAKFGALPAVAREIAKHARDELGLPVIGIAFHIGTLNSNIYMHPERHRLSRPAPEHELFDNYARILRVAARVRNALFAEGLVGPVVNTEGGLRPAYAYPEYDYREVLRSQMEVFETDFTAPVTWMIEPGRVFDPSAVAKFTVQNVDMVQRAGEGYPFVATEMALYTGAHDLQWGPRLVVRQSDVLAGRIYTPTSHPDEFDWSQLVGSACAGSDQVGIREGFKGVPLPKGLRPGEVLLFLPFGAYTSGGMGPQTGQMMYGRHRPEDRYYGFNGIQWPNVVVYEPGCPATGAPFPVEPLR